MLHQLQDAVKRGVSIVMFNPLRERGLVEFVNPQSPAEMLVKSPTRITSQYHQVKTGGDTAAMMGISKILFELEEKALHEGREPIIDHDFIREHTHGFEEFKTAAQATDWRQIERRSGLTRGALEAAAAVYAHAKSVMFIYGMGLTQHKKGVEPVQTVVNLALMRSNIGRQGAGICPVRGHSNAQGQRTVGITEKPEQVPADKLKTLFGIETPQSKGLNTVEACEKILDGSGQVKPASPIYCPNQRSSPNSPRQPRLLARPFRGTNGSPTTARFAMRLPRPIPTSSTTSMYASGSRAVSIAPWRSQTRVEDQDRQSQFCYAKIVVDGYRCPAGGPRGRAAHYATKQQPVQYNGLQS